MRKLKEWFLGAPGDKGKKVEFRAQLSRDELTKKLEEEKKEKELAELKKRLKKSNIAILGPISRVTKDGEDLVVMRVRYRSARINQEVALHMLASEYDHQNDIGLKSRYIAEKTRRIAHSIESYK